MAENTEASADFVPSPDNGGDLGELLIFGRPGTEAGARARPAPTR